jgi:hypothetical protein
MSIDIRMLYGACKLYSAVMHRGLKICSDVKLTVGINKHKDLYGSVHKKEC